MFYFHQENGENWAEYECPQCKVDMDFSIANVPPENTEFECPICNRINKVKYELILEY